MESSPASAALNSEEPDNLRANTFSGDFLSSSPVRGECGKSANNFDGMEIGAKEEGRESSSPHSCSPCPNEDDQRFSAVWTNGQLTKATGRKEGDSGFISPAGATNNGHVGMESVNPFNEVNFHQGLGKTVSNDFECSKTPSLGTEPEDKVLDSSLESENDHHYSYDNNQEDQEISNNEFNNYNIYNKEMDTKFDQTDNFLVQESEKIVIKGGIMDLKPVSNNFEDIQNYNKLENQQNGINNENFSFEENMKKPDTPIDFDSKESSPGPTEEEHVPLDNGVEDNKLISNPALNATQSELENDLNMVKGLPESSPELNIDKDAVDNGCSSEMSTFMEPMMTNSCNVDPFSNCDEEKLIEDSEKEETGYHYKLSEEDGCIGITSDPMTTSIFQMKDTEEDCPGKEAHSSDEEDHSEKKDEEKDYSSSASEAEEEQPYETLHDDVDKNCSKTEDLFNVTSGSEMNTMDVHTANKLEETASSDFVHLDKEEHNIKFEMQEQQCGEEPTEQDYNNLTHDTEMGYQIVEGTQKGFGDDHQDMQNDQDLLVEEPKSTLTFDAVNNGELDEMAVNTQNSEEIHSEKMEIEVEDDQYPEIIEDSRQFETSGEDLEAAENKSSTTAEDQNQVVHEENAATTDSEVMAVVDDQEEDKSQSDSDSDSSGGEAERPAEASTDPKVVDLEDAVKDNEKFDRELETNNFEITGDSDGPVSDSEQVEDQEDKVKDKEEFKEEIASASFAQEEDKVKDKEEFKEEIASASFAQEEKEHDQLIEASQNESLLVSEETGAEQKIELPETPQLEEKDFKEDEQMKMQNYIHADNHVPVETTEEEKAFNGQNDILNEPDDSQNFGFEQEETGHQENVKDDFDIQKPFEAPVEEKFDGSEDDFSVGQAQASVDPVINISAEVLHATEIQSYQELDNNVVDEFVQEETGTSLQSTGLDTMEMKPDNQAIEELEGQGGIKTQEIEAPTQSDLQSIMTPADDILTLPGITQPTVLDTASDNSQETKMKMEDPMPVFDDTKMQEPAYEIAKEPEPETTRVEKEEVSDVPSAEATFIEAVQSELHEPIYACPKDEPKFEAVEEDRKEEEAGPTADLKKEELIQETLLEKEETLIKTMNQELSSQSEDVQKIEGKEEIAEQEISNIEPTQTPQQEKEIVEKVEPEAVNAPADATSIETTNDYQTPSNDSVTNDQSSDDPKPLADETTPAQPDIKPDEKVSVDDVAKAAKSVTSALKKSPKPPTTLALTKTTPKAAGKAGPAPPSTRAATKPRAASSTTKAPATSKAASTTGPKTTTRPSSAAQTSAKPLTSGAARPTTRPASTRPSTAPAAKPPTSRPPTSRPATTSTRTARSAAQTARPETKTTSSTSTTPTPKPAGVARMKITPRTTSTSRLREASAARVKAERATTPASKPQTPTARTPLSSRTTPTTKAPTKRTPNKPTSASASSKELANTPFAKRQARLRAKSTEKKAPAEKREITEVNGATE